MEQEIILQEAVLLASENRFPALEKTYFRLRQRETLLDQLEVRC